MKTTIAILFIFLPIKVLAAAACDFQAQATAEDYVGQINRMLTVSQCFGGSRDDNPVTRQILGQLEQANQPMRTTQEVRAVQSLATTWLSDIELSLAAASSGVNATWAGDFALTSARLSEAMLQVSNLDARVQATPWTVDNLSYFDGSISLSDPIRESCSEGFDARCQAGLNSAAVLLRHAELTRTILTKIVAERRLIPLYKEVAALDAQWDTYFNDGRSQYIWELAFNSWRFQKTVSDDELAPPPKGQWILFHPTAALEYVDEGQNDNSEFNAVAVVELVGYNRLNWGEGSLLNGWPLGVSAIATVSLDDAGDTLGWGAMFHVRNTISLGVARRDAGSGTETTYLLSADLGKLFLSVSGAAKKQFRFQ